MAEIKDIIRSLVQQCNVESISTKNLAHELGELYGRVERLQDEVKSANESLAIYRKETEKAREELEKYKRTYVDPVDLITANRRQLDLDTFKFNLEKEYLSRENNILKETLRVVTSNVSFDESYNGGSHGSSGHYNKHTRFNDANLPVGPLMVDKKDKS